MEERQNLCISAKEFASFDGIGPEDQPKVYLPNEYYIRYLDSDERKHVVGMDCATIPTTMHLHTGKSEDEIVIVVPRIHLQTFHGNSTFTLHNLIQCRAQKVEVNFYPFSSY